MKERFLSWGLPLLLVAALWAIGFAVLDDYAVTWDEALGDFFFGQRYWSFYTTFDPVYLDFASEPYPPGHVPDLSSSWQRGTPVYFYALGGTLAAATSALLSSALGWLDPFDGYHAVNLLLAAILIAVWYRFLVRRFDALVAGLSIVLLFASPRIWCDLMANIKDFPEMVFFSVALVGFLAALTAGRVEHVGACGVLWGLALAAKTNALFIAPIVGLLALIVPLSPRIPGRLHAVAALALAGTISVVVLVLLWPYTWGDLAGRLWEHLSFVVSRKDLTRPESIAPPFAQILYTTPIPFLLAFAVGLWPTLRGALARRPAELLLALWTCVVFGRLYLPNAVNFDGVRHFLELFPPMSAIAAIGVAWLIGHVRRLPWSAALQRDAIVVLVAAGPLWMAATVVRTHPFQIAYWNALIGGHGGAVERRMAQAGDYWGESYRQGLRWLDENAVEGAALAVPIAEHAVRLVAPLWLRRDIELLPLTSPEEAQIDPARLEYLAQVAAERPVYVMFVPREDWMNQLALDCMQRLQPEHAFQLDGAPVLLIYRYEAISYTAQGAERHAKTRVNHSGSFSLSPSQSGYRGSGRSPST